METHDVLAGSLWNAGLEYYDFLCRVEFGPDGTGMMSAGGGQVLRFAAKLRYEILDNTWVEFEFFDTILDFWGQTFRRTEENAFRSVQFDIEEGEFEINEPYIGTQKYQYRLHFSASPFPVGEAPEVAEFVNFYGWKLLGR